MTPGLVAWCKQHGPDRGTVLVPGCGSGHDAHYLARQGFRVTAVDYAPAALAAARLRYPNSTVHWQLEDVLAMPFEASFSRVWEYTCFCALHPDQRRAYFSAVHRALEPDGTYWGMVFCKVPREEPRPPYPIEPQDFRDLLSELFEVRTFEAPTRRSVKPRRGNEIWFEAIKT